METKTRQSSNRKTSIHLRLSADDTVRELAEEKRRGERRTYVSNSRYEDKPFKTTNEKLKTCEGKEVLIEEDKLHESLKLLAETNH